jgi:hypothetical protein
MIRVGITIYCDGEIVYVLLECTIVREFPTVYTYKHLEIEAYIPPIGLTQVALELSLSPRA